MVSHSPSVLAIVPARGGSKRILNKNLTPLGGKPLILYTLEAVKKIANLAFTVSTDDVQIAELAQKQGAVIPELRPPSLALDTSPVMEAITHSVQTWEQTVGSVDIVMVLQTTSPFRTQQDLESALELFESHQADTVTAVKIPQDHPYWMWQAQQQFLSPFFSKEHMMMTRHEVPPVMVETGAIFIFKRELVDQQTFYGNKVVPYLMDEISSLDIDTDLDLQFAEFLLKTGKVKK